MRLAKDTALDLHERLETTEGWDSRYPRVIVSSDSNQSR
jgi:hypothetical protein